MIVERILHIIKVKGLNKRQFYQLTELSNGFLDKVKDVGVSKIEKILYAFPDIDAYWLITGEGDMLRSFQNQSEYSTALPEVCEPKGSENYTADVTSDIIKAKNEVIRSKDDLLKSKDELIAVLKYRLELAENYQPSKRNSA